LRPHPERVAYLFAIATALGLLAVGCGPFEAKKRRSAQPPPEAAPALPAARSLEPRFRLLPRAEYARIAAPVAGSYVAASDGDFESPATLVSAEAKLDEIAAQLAQERGAGASFDLIPSAEDRERARRIPFRGNPSDVAIARLSGETRVFVPLGGDLMTPGNEVAALRLAPGGAELLARIRVGIRPERLAVDPAGLVYVCNAYSNFISVIDAATATLLGTSASPSRIATDFHCSDLELLVEASAPGAAERRQLFVANRWRQSVLRYRIELVRDATGKLVDLRQTPADGSADAELRDAGASPTRLALDPASSSLYALSWRGGEVARIDLASFRVGARFDAGAPAIDFARFGDRALLATTMPDRGLLAAGSALPPRRDRCSGRAHRPRRPTPRRASRRADRRDAQLQLRRHPQRPLRALRRARRSGAALFHR
jgi:YVTN family beta-propeller protein